MTKSFSSTGIQTPVAVREPWQDHAGSLTERKARVLEEVEGHLEHSSEPVREACISSWRRKLQMTNM
jgi:hypothetical protein